MMLLSLRVFLCTPHLIDPLVTLLASTMLGYVLLGVFSTACIAEAQATLGSSTPFFNLNASATFSSPTATGNISLLVVTATVNLNG